ncbi:MAG: hypothetical protein ACR2H3_12920 [Acidimicrobiales bacterium]
MAANVDVVVQVAGTASSSPAPSPLAITGGPVDSLIALAIALVLVGALLLTALHFYTQGFSTQRTSDAP